MPRCTCSIAARMASAAPAACAAFLPLAAVDSRVNSSRSAPRQADATTTFHAPRVGLSTVNGAAAAFNCAAIEFTSVSAAAIVR